jgi:hypothetical protein
MTVIMSRPPALPPDGYYSPDGQWWWNGSQWLAVPSGPPPRITSQSAFKTGFFGWLGVSTARSVSQCFGCVLFLLILVVILAVAGAQAH